jgi:hypothetical protein
MRLKPLLYAGVVAALVAGSCSDDEEAVGVEQLSEYALEYLSTRMGSMSAMGDARNSPVNQSFNGIMNNLGLAGGRVSDDSTVIGDTTVIDPGYWTTCAEVSETENEDGSRTIVYDYGEGCDEGWGDWTYILRGKWIQTSLNQVRYAGTTIHNDYRYTMDYENYGGTYTYDTMSYDWELNGGSDFEGYSMYDTVNYEFSGRYSYEDDTEYTYDNLSYRYISSGESFYDSKQYVIEASDYRYSNGSNYYQVTVLKPLVYKYDCWLEMDQLNRFCFWMTYVSGQERISYQQGEERGEFIIDYGDGSCDNIIYIIENGERIKIDLSQSWAVLTQGD